MDISNGVWFRFGIFLFLLAMFALAEARRPWRIVPGTRKLRWPGNLGLSLSNSLLSAPLSAPVFLLAGLIPLGKGAAGLLNLTGPAHVLFALILLDLGIYFQHRLFHTVGFLWVLHRTHHTDSHLDVTSSLRFHPLEIVVSMVYKALLIRLIGASPVEVLVFDVLLNASAQFHHSNILLPRGADGILRLFIITPDMHRTHHSRRYRECNSNYGFFLTLWDRLLGTYRAEPQNGRKKICLGLPGYNDPKDQKYPGMLAAPFLRGKRKA